MKQTDQRQTLKTLADGAGHTFNTARSAKASTANSPNSQVQAKFLRGWLRRLNALRAEIGLPGSDISFGDASGDISFTPPIAGADSPLAAEIGRH